VGVSSDQLAGYPVHDDDNQLELVCRRRHAEQQDDRGVGESEPLVLLDDSIAADPALVGGKAATLARARAAGLPTLPGVVVTMRADVASLASDPARLSALLREHLGDGPLIARSSSSVEDSPQHSMAGRFDTIAGVNEDHEIADAVLAVVRSAERVAAEDQLDEVPPIAVLVQPMVDPRFGGVCFGVEPVTGRIDRKFAVVSTSGPDAVVSGRVAGVRHLLDGQGRLLRRDGDDDWEANLDRRRRRELTSLMDRLAALFGGPQDVEFLEDRQGELILLQSRPVTTELRGTPSGPVYGTGPVAETFPEGLSALEQDLWVPPLRDGLREALKVTAMASRSDLRQRPLVVVNDGRVAIDLQMVGALPAGPRWRGWFAVRPLARRARATWRVGQLRAALPALARDLVGTADEALAGAGSLGELSDRQLVGLLQRGRTALRSLHGHEVLIGLLSGQATSNLTGLSVALRALVAARQKGLDDAEIIARSPVVLALTGPRIDGVSLPEGAPALPPPLPAEATGDEAAILREALRIRIRWVQELTASRTRARYEAPRSRIAAGSIGGLRSRFRRRCRARDGRGRGAARRLSGVRAHRPKRRAAPRALPVRRRRTRRCSHRARRRPRGRCRRRGGFGPGHARRRRGGAGQCARGCGSPTVAGPGDRPFGWTGRRVRKPAGARGHPRSGGRGANSRRADRGHHHVP